MKQILVATDFSKGAQVALNLATELAKKHIATITLFHCQSPIFVDPSLPYSMIETMEEDRTKETTIKLEKLARSVQEKGVLTQFELSKGAVYEAINKLAEEKEFDLVVMGKTGETGFLEKLVGGTAVHVINNIEIPLLVVPEDSSVETIDKVIYATELEYEEHEILHSVFNFAERSKADVEFLNVQSDNQLDLINNDTLVNNIKGYFPNKPFKLRSIKSNNVKRSILEVSSGSPNTCLVLARHHRNFLDGILKPSISKKIIAEATVPTLVYHFA